MTIQKVKILSYIMVLHMDTDLSQDLIKKGGDKSSASAYYEKALVLDPDSWSTRERLRLLVDI